MAIAIQPRYILAVELQTSPGEEVRSSNIPVIARLNALYQTSPMWE